MLFTTTNKALMQRAARHLTEQAGILKNSYGQNWAASKEAKVAKRQYDRLLRDARDMRELATALDKDFAFLNQQAKLLTPEQAQAAKKAIESLPGARIEGPTDASPAT